MTTTLKLIREQQSTLIRALTPTSLAGNLFREYSRREDFLEWAEDTPNAALRRFFIEDDTEYEIPLSSNMDDEEIETRMTVTVAYPHDSRYGKGETKTMRDVIREDMHQIDTAIGHRGYGSYVSGQNKAEAETKTIEKGENVDFLTMNYSINFRRAM